jgi:hypothetical protein
MRSNIRCFVAMAFGRSDTDAIFSAQRTIPVIYTVRKDHFKPRPDDEYGNFRIHFDVQNRNIVNWSSPTDATFEKGLRSRITKVIAPILRQKQTQLEQKQRITDFDRLSLHDKRVTLVDAGFKYFQRLRYTITNAVRHHSDDDSKKTVKAPSELTAPGFMAVRKIGTTLNFVAFQVEPNITVKLAYRYNVLLTFPAYDYMEAFQADKSLTQIKEDIITCSFGSEGLNRLSKSISGLHAGEFDRTLQCDITYDPRRYKQPMAAVPRHVTFHIFESSARLVDLAKTLEQRFKAR